jgi:hypothetical protein
MSKLSLRNALSQHTRPQFRQSVGEGYGLVDFEVQQAFFFVEQNCVADFPIVICLASYVHENEQSVDSIKELVWEVFQHFIWDIIFSWAFAFGEVSVLSKETRFFAQEVEDGDSLIFGFSGLAFQLELVQIIGVSWVLSIVWQKFAVFSAVDRVDLLLKEVCAICFTFSGSLLIVLTSFRAVI